MFSIKFLLDTYRMGFQEEGTNKNKSLSLKI